jgi:hypothetical protein
LSVGKRTLAEARGNGRDAPKAFPAVMNAAIAPLIVVARRPRSPPPGGCYDPEASRTANAASQLRPSTEPLLTMSEQITLAADAAAAVDIPMGVDAGAGFGEPLHTMRTVREFIRAGIAGVHIEDQLFPKWAHYHTYQVHEITPEEFARRYNTLAARGTRSIPTSSLSPDPTPAANTVSTWRPIVSTAVPTSVPTLACSFRAHGMKPNAHRGPVVCRWST